MAHQGDELEERLQALTLNRKSKRLRRLWPAIEARLADGVSQKEVLRLLSEHGIHLSLLTFKNYLHRHRKQKKSKALRNKNAEGTHPSQILLVHSPVSSTTRPANRPPQFHHDPTGIPPDLLK